MQYTFENSLGRLTQDVSKYTGKVLEEEFKKAGIKILRSEWIALSYINHYKEQSQNQLVTAIGENKVYITRLIDSMEKKGWVERHPGINDKRFNRIILTKKGNTTYNKLVPYAEDVLKKARETIPKNDLDICITTLHKVINNLEQLLD